MAQEILKTDLKKVHDYLYEIPKTFRSDMRVPAHVFVSENMLDDILHDKSLWQIANVATLPGIEKAAIAMPDVHQGYGFPIGGVAAMDIDSGGVISPGGIGYDINCGVRLLASNVQWDEIKDSISALATRLFKSVPSGVGRGGKLKMKQTELDRVLCDGVKEMVRLGYGTDQDEEYCESHGCMVNANPEMVSPEAKKRGADQLGTLGSGNHFLEVQVVDEIYDEQAANAFGLKRGLVTVMIHTGSRGLGHQVCTDYVKLMMPLMDKWGFVLPDRELVCVPFMSDEGQRYFNAMAAACNFAWSNRHLITHWTRGAWRDVLGSGAQLSLVYDIAHNIGKRETHIVNGKEKELLVHRKGATRAFGPGHSEIPAAYQAVGQPVLIPGTMGTSSYILAGTQEAMNVSFGSSCHGAGRRLSRMRAKREIHGSELRKQLEARGIIIRCDSDPGLAEEAPLAYKDVDNVVQVVVDAKIAKKVARVRPVAVIKGG